jgi:hypothetical protein
MDDRGKVNVKVIRFTEVIPMPDNPRVIDDVALTGLRESVKRFGYVEPIVWNERTGHIVGGHQRFKVLNLEGLKEAPMVVVDMTPEDEMAANLTLNNPEIEGEFSEGALELLKSVQGADLDLFGKLRLDDLTSDLEKKFATGGLKEFNNKEIDIASLIEGCDAKCPCCGFVWTSDEDDQVDLEKLS